MHQTDFREVYFQHSTRKRVEVSIRLIEQLFRESVHAVQHPVLS